MHEWISVEDRLPEFFDSGVKKNWCSDSVLVTDGQYVQVGLRWKNGQEEYFLPDYREEFTKITHWMPLPALPNKKNDVS